MTKANYNKLNGKINVALHQAQLSGDGGEVSKGQCSTPRIAKMADRSREKEMVQRIQDCTECYVVQQAS